MRYRRPGGPLLPTTSASAEERSVRSMGMSTAANVVTGCGTPSSRISKSSLVRPVTTRPSASVTIAVTWTASIEERNVGVGGCCAWPETTRPPATTQTAAPRTQIRARRVTAFRSTAGRQCISPVQAGQLAAATQTSRVLHASETCNRSPGLTETRFADHSWYDAGPASERAPAVWRT